MYFRLSLSLIEKTPQGSVVWMASVALQLLLVCPEEESALPDRPGLVLGMLSPCSSFLASLLSVWDASSLVCAVIPAAGDWCSGRILQQLPVVAV